MRGWNRLRLKGKEQTIPDLCPNCLGATTHRFRYGYKGWKGMLTNTTYFQTFYYCEPCMNQADSAMGLGGWTVLGVILGIITFGVTLAVSAEAWRDPQTRLVPDAMVALGMILALLAGALPTLGIRALAKFIKQKRHPKTQAQAVWGPAAFYAGSGVMDMQNQCVYLIARREWAAEMVRLNPEQVDDAAYQAWVGQPRPESPTQGRPFGG
jgi:hypothetical protein